MTRRIVAVGLLLTVFTATAEALEFPALPDIIHSAIAGARPDLVRLHGPLKQERGAVLAKGAAFDRACGRVEVGSAQDAQCRRDFPVLLQEAEQHCRKSVEFIKAYAQAVDAALVPVPQEKGRLMEQLSNLQTQFQNQASSFQAWGGDAQRGLEQTIEKIAEVSLVSLGSALTKMSEKEALARVEQMVEKAKLVKNVKRVRTTELKDYVLALREELQGKSPEQAKGIVLASLRNDRQFIIEARAVANQVAETGLRRILPSEDPPVTELALRDAYGVVVAATEAAATQGVKVVQTLGKAAGVIALLPSVLDAGVLTWEAFVDETNIDAMEQLRSLAERRRAAASLQLTNLMTTQRELENLRAALQRSSQHECR